MTDTESHWGGIKAMPVQDPAWELAQLKSALRYLHGDGWELRHRVGGRASLAPECLVELAKDSGWSVVLPEKEQP